MKTVQELLDNAIPEGECLECWLTPSQVYPNIKGYGKVHRYIWEQTKGPIPEGMLVCHSCDNPRCINVYHLFLGTSQDNMDDKVKKGRQHFGGPGTTLSLIQWGIIIKARYDGKTYEEIGNHLRVSRRTVKRFLERCPHD